MISVFNIIPNEDYSLCFDYGLFPLLHISLLQASFLHPSLQLCFSCFHKLINAILVVMGNAFLNVVANVNILNLNLVWRILI